MCIHYFCSSCSHRSCGYDYQNHVRDRSSAAVASLDLAVVTLSAVFFLLFITRDHYDDHHDSSDLESVHTMMTMLTVATMMITYDSVDHDDDDDDDEDDDDDDDDDGEDDHADGANVKTTWMPVSCDAIPPRHYRNYDDMYCLHLHCRG